MHNKVIKFAFVQAILTVLIRIQQIIRDSIQSCDEIYRKSTLYILILIYARWQMKNTDLRNNSITKMEVVE